MALLLRSAAALAYKAKMYKESEQLIEVCRSENPPTYILEDLNKITDLIRRAQGDTDTKRDSSIQLEGVLTQVNADENEITLKDVKQAKNFAIIVPKENMVAQLELFQDHFLELLNWLRSIKFL